MEADDEHWMRTALAEAQAAGERGEVPVGAVVVRDGVLLARAGNAPIARTDPSAHAEIEAIRQAAAQIGNYRLVGATLYVTLEPCVMCMGAILQARLTRLVYGSNDPKAGAVTSLFQLADDPRLNHRLPVTASVCAEESRRLLQEFFRVRRT